MTYNKEGQTVQPSEFASPRFSTPSDMREGLPVVEKGPRTTNLMIVHQM